MIEPQPKPIERVGPSQASDLLECGYKVAWNRDPQTPSGNSHPKALLGTIGHRTCELGALGRLGVVDDGWEHRFDEAWDELTTIVAAENPEQGEPGRWPGYNLQRVSWKRQARAASERAVFTNDAPIDGVVGAGLRSDGPEVELSGFEGRIAGTADVIVRHGDDVEIRDLKSGRVLGEKGELSEGYQRQLLLYAAIYEDRFGIWPQKLMIDPLVRPPIEVKADRPAARKAVEETLAAIDGFNLATEQGNLESLARPSKHACNFCPHVTRCRPFWLKANPSWSGRPPAFKGTIISTRPGQLDVNVDSGTIDPGVWTIGGVPPETAGTDEKVMIAWFERRPQERRLGTGEQTVFQVTRPDEVGPPSDRGPDGG